MIDKQLADALSQLRSLLASPITWTEIEQLTADWSKQFKGMVWGQLEEGERHRVNSLKSASVIKVGDKVTFVEPNTREKLAGKVIEYIEEKGIFRRAVVEYFHFGKTLQASICRKDWIRAGKPQGVRQ